MSHIRLTQQEADPIGAITATPIVTVGAILAVLTSIALTIVHWHEVGTPLVAVLGIVFVAAAGLTAVRSAAPARAPFTVERLWLVVAFAVAAAIAEFISTIGADRTLYDNFGPLVIGMLILSVAPYCTWISLALAGVISAAVTSILMVGTASPALNDVPIVSLLAVNAASVLAMSAAAAGYSYAIVDETLAWERDANRAALQRDAELRAGIARSVQQNRVSLLGREVLPFLASIRTADRISVADADRARELADALRRALKAGIESTWLDDLGANVELSHDIAVVIDDPTGAADDLDDDQRSALTALVDWLGDASRSAVIRVSVVVRPDHRRIVIEADHGASPPSRRELDLFAAVARATAMRAETTITRENIRMELSHVPE